MPSATEIKRKNHELVIQYNAATSKDSRRVVFSLIFQNNLGAVKQFCRRWLRPSLHDDFMGEAYIVLEGKFPVYNQVYGLSIYKFIEYQLKGVLPAFIQKYCYLIKPPAYSKKPQGRALMELYNTWVKPISWETPIGDGLTLKDTLRASGNGHLTTEEIRTGLAPILSPSAVDFFLSDYQAEEGESRRLEYRRKARIRKKLRKQKEKVMDVLFGC